MCLFYAVKPSNALLAWSWLIRCLILEAISFMSIVAAASSERSPSDACGFHPRGSPDSQPGRANRIRACTFCRSYGHSHYGVDVSYVSRTGLTLVILHSQMLLDSSRATWTQLRHFGQMLSRSFFLQRLGNLACLKHFTGLFTMPRHVAVHALLVVACCAAEDVPFLVDLPRGAGWHEAVAEVCERRQGKR